MIDLLLFFLLMAVGYRDGGIRGFRKQIKNCALRLAGMAMRSKLLTPSSVSRALQATDRIDDLDKKTAWLLSEGASVRELACSQSVQTRDANGDYWMPLDFDPSVKVFRNRALPACEELPEAVRLSPDLCLPGYPRRHRGQKQMSTAILSHTGAGLYLQAVTYAGNAPFTEALATAAVAAAAFADLYKISRSRTIVRFDGAGGYGAAIAAVIAQGLHYLTRLRYYSVFSDPAALEVMRTGVWFDVIDSGSGQKRQAMQLGQLWMEDGKGGGFWTRLVVSRFVNSNDKKDGAGVLCEGWQYEAYAMDLPSDCFPAPDAVSLYYARCGQENLFGRGAQDVRLNELFSHDIKGQQLAQAMMMWGHNLMMSRAAEHAGELGKPPAQTPRPVAQIAVIYRPAPVMPPSDTKMTSSEPAPVDAAAEPTKIPNKSAPKRPSRSKSQYQLPEHRTPGPLRVAGPCLMVAGLLRAWHDEQARFVIDVRLNPRKKVEKISPYLAASDAERQRRRQTWTQSNGKNECRCRPKVVRSPIAQEWLAA